jgi:hypothetical protein
MTVPTSKAQIRDRFRLQLVALASGADSAYQAATLQGQRRWMSPDLGEWSGDLNDLAGLSKAFDRSEIAQDAKDAVRDAKEPGVVGDMMVSQLQGDYLACQERAYRCRHLTPLRARMHAAGRLKGHGHDAGLFNQTVMNYLTGILRASKIATREGKSG